MYKLVLISNDGKTDTFGGEFETYEDAHAAGMLYGHIFFIDMPRKENIVYEETFKTDEFKSEICRLEEKIENHLEEITEKLALTEQTCYDMDYKIEMSYEEITERMNNLDNEMDRITLRIDRI